MSSDNEGTVVKELGVILTIIGLLLVGAGALIGPGIGPKGHIPDSEIPSE